MPNKTSTIRFVVDRLTLPASDTSRPSASPELPLFAADVIAALNRNAKAPDNTTAHAARIHVARIELMRRHSYRNAPLMTDRPSRSPANLS